MNTAVDRDDDIINTWDCVSIICLPARRVSRTVDAAYIGLALRQCVELDDVAVAAAVWNARVQVTTCTDRQTPAGTSAA